MPRWHEGEPGVARTRQGWESPGSGSEPNDKLLLSTYYGRGSQQAELGVRVTQTRGASSVALRDVRALLRGGPEGLIPRRALPVC